MASSAHLVEQLIAAVARAFYADTFVVIFDALIREKYIIEEELAPRLKLSSKDVRKITTQLESEMMVKTEELTVDTKTFKCYYIDHQTFVNVVRYRIHLMQNTLNKAEKLELNDIFYQCPTCGEKYSSLEAQRLLSGDYKFICSHCCPHENFRSMTSETYYRLVEVDNRGKLNKLQILERKIDRQLNHSKYHVGIFDLLHQLRNSVLSRNRPSDNYYGRGIRTSAVTDDDVKEQIEYNLGDASVVQATDTKKVAMRKRAHAALTTGEDLVAMDGGASASAGGARFEIRIESEETSRQSPNAQDRGAFTSGSYDPSGVGLSSTATAGSVRSLAPASAQSSSEAHAAALHESLPEFLRDSRVFNAANVLQEAHSLQTERSAGVAAATAATKGEGGQQNVYLDSAALLSSTINVEKSTSSIFLNAAESKLADDHGKSVEESAVAGGGSMGGGGIDGEIKVEERDGAVVAVAVGENQIDEEDIDDVDWEEG